MIEMPIARKKVFVNGLCAHEEKRSKVKVSQIIFSTELMKWVINRRIYAFLALAVFKSKYHEIILSYHFNIFLETASEKMKMPVPPVSSPSYIYIFFNPSKTLQSN